ncbi:MAG: hypothetical protein WCI17_07155 [bacterium]
MAVAVAGLAILALLLWLLRRERIPEVPLGVEHAVVIRYRGPELVLKPFRRGVDVNLRLERAAQQGDARVYDFRYIVNQPGLFDISTYLAAADGRPLPDLPSFQVRGVTRLSRAMERRIREVEEVGISIPHLYYEFMAAAILAWIAGFFLLVFWGRRRAVIAPAAAPVSLASVLRELLERLRAGTLDAAGKAQLETVMFRCWREQLGLTAVELLAGLRQIEAGERSGETYRMLEEWLHSPASQTPDAEVIARLAPYGVESATAARKEA